jgi:2-keto-3-deoxy-L-rhamnonate aldolase RhmA
MKDQLQKRHPLIGTMVTIGSSMISEILSSCGFDWLWIDMEHSTINLEQVQHLVQSMRNNCASIVRVPFNDHIWIKQVLDIGVDGIIVPQVMNAQEAENAIKAAKYPPRGIRGVGGSRAQGYGLNFSNYIQEANDRGLVVLQIEHVDAVRNIEEILQVPGFDAIMIGPSDLAASFGKLGQPQDPEVQTAIETVRSACAKHKMPAGIFALHPEDARKYLKQGFQLVATGIDSHYLWGAAKASLSLLR